MLKSQGKRGNCLSFEIQIIEQFIEATLKFAQICRKLIEILSQKRKQLINFRACPSQTLLMQW